MAILKNLLVSGGASRFLGTSYFQDISIAGSAALASLSLSGNLSVTGTSTLTGHVSIGGYNNASYGLSASSAIINDWIRTTGSTGWYNQSHRGGWYMTDDDYVRSYLKPVMMGHNLYFNSTSYYVNTSGGASFSSIAAPTATISNATISGDLTVNGVLQANDFIKNIVKAVGGQLYVSPTFQATSSTTVTCTAVTATQLSLTLSDNAIDGTDYAGATWYKDSKVMLSGTLTANTTGHTEEIIFSSVPGVVTANMSSSNKLQIKLDYDGASTYFKTNTTLTTSDVAVMMYQINIPSGSANAGLHPIGIYIKAYGTDNKNSYIDIFGGTSNTPNARLGLLNGLPNMQNGTQIKGWGIATTNGFFDGTIVSSSGKIGAFTLGDDLRSGTWGTSGSVLVAGGYTPTTADAKSIGGSPTTGNTWAFTAGNAFGVTTTGKLYASSAEISGKITANSGSIAGWAIGSDFLHKDISGYRVGLYAPTSPTANNAAFYIATYDGTKETAYPFRINYSGKLYAEDADIKGKVTATSGSIGKFNITTSYIDTYQDLSNKTSATNAGFGGNQAFWAGNGSSNSAPFRVSYSGDLVATSATISGTLNAGANSTIGPWTVSTTSIYKAANTLGSTTSGAAYFGDLGLSVGSKFKVDATGVATLGLSSGYHATMDTDSFDVLNGSTMLATFGQTATIGNMSARGVSIDENGFKFNNDGNQAFYIGIDSRTADSVVSSTGTTITNQVSTTTVDNVVYYRLCAIDSTTKIVNVTSQGAINLDDPDYIETGIWLTDGSTINLTWVIDSGYLWVHSPQYEEYTNFRDTVYYEYLVSTTTNSSPYCVIGTSAYTGDVVAGSMSLAQGYLNKATGPFSTALGSYSESSGDSSFACGNLTKASGDYSFACGQYSQAKGECSIAMQRSEITGQYSVGVGLYNTTYGDRNYSIGYGNRIGTESGEGANSFDNYAYGSSNRIFYFKENESFHGIYTASSTSAARHCFAFGNYNYVASNDEYGLTVAIGSDNIAMNGGVAIGHNVVSSSGLVIGKYNSFTSTTSTTTQRTTVDSGDYAFVIGNGTSDSARSNAFTVDNYGVVGFSGVAMFGDPANTFSITSHVVNNNASVASQGYAASTLTIEKQGYYPLCVAGYNCTSRYLVATRFYLTNQQSGSGTLNYMIYNPTSSARTATCTMWVMWVKTT